MEGKKEELRPEGAKPSLESPALEAWLVPSLGKKLFASGTSRARCLRGAFLLRGGLPPAGAAIREKGLLSVKALRRPLSWVVALIARLSRRGVEAGLGSSKSKEGSCWYAVRSAVDACKV
jgi:hypothetical protein